MFATVNSFSVDRFIFSVQQSRPTNQFGQRAAELLVRFDNVAVAKARLFGTLKLKPPCASRCTARSPYPLD